MDAATSENATVLLTASQVTKGLAVAAPQPILSAIHSQSTQLLAKGHTEKRGLHTVIKLAEVQGVSGRRPGNLNGLPKPDGSRPR